MLGYYIPRPGRHPPDQAGTPPGPGRHPADQTGTPWDQAGIVPGPGTSPGLGTPPGQGTPPEQSMLGDMVNERAVCILLECNLVHGMLECFHETLQSSKKCAATNTKSSLQ